MPPKPTDTEDRVPDAAVESAGHVLETCEEERVRALLHSRPGEPSYPVDRRIDARKALAAALPSLEASFKERVREGLAEADRALAAWHGDEPFYDPGSDSSEPFSQDAEFVTFIGHAVRDALAALDSEDPS